MIKSYRNIVELIHPCSREQGTGICKLSTSGKEIECFYLGSELPSTSCGNNSKKEEHNYVPPLFTQIFACPMSHLRRHANGWCETLTQLDKDYGNCINFHTNLGHGRLVAAGSSPFPTTGNNFRLKHMTWTATVGILGSLSLHHATLYSAHFRCILHTVRSPRQCLTCGAPAMFYSSLGDFLT